MPATRKTVTCHHCLESYLFNKKNFDWVRTKTFKWVSEEVDSSYYFIPVCMECQAKELKQTKKTK